MPEETTTTIEDALNNTGIDAQEPTGAENDQSGADDQTDAGDATLGTDEANSEGSEGEDEQELTLEDILKADPAIKAEFDRKMQAAIAKHDARLQAAGAGNQRNSAEQDDAGYEDDQSEEEQVDLDEIIDQRVEARINEERFAGCVQNLLERAGITDTQGYLSHIDLDDLYEHYDPATDTIPGYEDLEAEMREEYPFYFGTEAGGMDHGTFGGNDGPLNLRDALMEKYGAK